MASPKPTVAIVGASPKPERFSHRSLLAHLACGYEVYPVNPRGGQIAGLTVYTTLADTPGGRLDRVSFYVGPDVGIGLLDAVAEKGCDELWLNPGTDAPEVIARAEELGLNPIVACSLVDCQQRTAG